MKILFVNNSAFFSSNRVRKLRDLGFEVTFRQNAGKVLEIFAGPKETWPDILVMDDLLCQGDTEEVNAHSTNDFTQTGRAIYEILRGKDIDTPVLVYTTSRWGYEKLIELGTKDLRLVAIYECDGNPTQDILAPIQKLATLVK